MCDDGRRSKLRNQQLLAEFDRLQAEACDLNEQINSLSAIQVTAGSHCVEVVFVYLFIEN